MMSHDINNYSKLLVPTSKERLSSRDILLGKSFDPIKQIAMYSDKEFEIFVAEWASTLEGKYAGTFKAKDGGDRGCDLIGFYHNVPSTSWDNYQCKHYDNAISPAQMTTEIIKIIYYCFIKAYSIPQKYYFVAPQGLSNMSMGLLMPQDKIELRKRIKEAWNDDTPDKELVLDDTIKSYIDSFDLSIFSFVDVQDLVTQHSKTRWGRIRFGGGLVARSSTPILAPLAIHSDEASYISELQKVYSEQAQKELSIDDIRVDPKYVDHFNRQRRFFYNAESLRIHARETLPNNGDFEDLQDQIHDGVIALVESNHASSLDRLNSVIQRAQDVQISEHVLKPELRPADRSGICHQLVNDSKFKWKK